MNEELDSQLSAMFDDELPEDQCQLLARRLSRDEAVHLPEIAARFDEFDLNRDGWLSFAEFAIAATAAAK